MQIKQHEWQLPYHHASQRLSLKPGPIVAQSMSAQGQHSLTYADCSHLCVLTQLNQRAKSVREAGKLQRSYLYCSAPHLQEQNPQEGSSPAA